MQRPHYEDKRGGIEAKFRGFTAISADGALLGSWNLWLHQPELGGPVWELTKALSMNPRLPKPVRGVSILVTGAHFRSAYEIYAHGCVAEHIGLSDDKLATIVAGQRPPDLTREEGLAYDVASALVGGGVLSNSPIAMRSKHSSEPRRANFATWLVSTAWFRSS